MRSNRRRSGAGGAQVEAVDGARCHAASRRADPPSLRLRHLFHQRLFTGTVPM